MFENIDAFVNRCASFTESELDIFHSLIDFKTVHKKEYLLREGQICDFEAYVLKGCVRNYFINENGFEVIIQFAIEDWWISDIASFHEKTPSKLYIETLEDCELFFLSYENKEELLKRVPKFERFFRLMVQKNLSSTQNRLINTIAKSAPEKYLDFIKLYPTIPQRVPQHYIASYLGISAEFLSKIRTKLSKQ
ncbi:putative Crp/Fnr family transcriptional regulator [Flavobacterium cauense R2A-7]|uniref:CRP-like cAMP-binding protein n=1 Tax=Flavobacterium cauense R2A-7 TaxID=1341154 RepID=V6S3K0_9FLAO|nr:Crp/Fnr family transcriptional regulator [Flavobacterium cauense]ESU18965.1 putative Crp/Fnr family transcriptional regulator [Flavobacterium cauense R2A-7]KGO82403.1 Crp/Fnr family transcriptional regulator [Flavobacterium cauense R2A-7]TWI15378.1 CRP-like cAMP-binding protein [Flavobacterium cauense R2A-7]